MEERERSFIEQTRRAGRRWGDSTFGKLTVLGLLVVVLLIPVSRVTELIRERMQRQAEVEHEIAAGWGGSQSLLGPVLTVPYTVTQKRVVVERTAEDAIADGGGRTVQRTEATTHQRLLYVLPSEVSWVARIEPEIRYRGLFDVVVYEAAIEVSGSFERPRLEDTDDDRLAWDRAVLVLGVSDVRGLGGRAKLEWGGRELEFFPGTAESGLAGGIHAPLPGWDPGEAGERVPFSFELVLRGAGDLLFLPAGEETRVELSSPWPSPGFTGAFLPAVREIGPDGFTAGWRVPHFGRGYGQLWSDQEVGVQQLAGSTFGVSLVLPADAYQQTERAVKYAVLFVVLTFGTFFLLELLSPARLHGVQYLLVGFALVVFYVLLLALGEHLGFTAAYVAAAAATVGLIAAYSRSILGDRRRAGVVLGALAILYGYLYVLLRLEDYALLLGALGLFAALAVTMRLTRHLDWYSLTFGGREPAAGPPPAEG